MSIAPYLSAYAYAYDVADRGVATFVGDVQSAGLHSVSLAASYHAGKFLRPHAATNTVVFPEDGVVYFEPRHDAYGEIKPLAHSNAALRQVFPTLLDDARLQVHAWIVLFHNSRLGALHPQYTAQNALGDRYVYSLCPMHPPVLDYGVALCADIAAQFKPQSVIVETPGWLPYAHGYHHEFAQVAGNPWLDGALACCFCSACLQAAQDKGIDAVALRARVAQRIRNYLAAPVDAQADQAHAWMLADVMMDADWLAYQHLRRQRVTQVVQRLRQALPSHVALAVIPTVQRPSAACWIEGSDMVALSQVADFLEVPFYEPDVMRFAADVFDTCSRVPEAQRHRIRAIMRPGPPDLRQGADVPEALAVLRRHGIEGCGFYNFGLLRQHHWHALGRALATRDAGKP